VATRKYRTCGHGGVRRGSALLGTRLNARATKATLVAEIRATRYFTGSSAGFRELGSVLSGCNRPRMCGRRKKTTR
jgi:hypothetical protein